MFVCIINYGSFSTLNISKILSNYNISYEIIDKNQYPKYIPTHVILSGGPEHVYEKCDILPNWIIYNTFPVLGICYGCQVIVNTFGGEIKKFNLEKGIYQITNILNNEKKYVWLNHYDYITKIPKDFKLIEIVDNSKSVASLEYGRFTCVMYHPESFKIIDLECIVKFLMKL